MIEVKNSLTTVVSTLSGVATQQSLRSVSSNHYDLFGRVIATVDGNGNVNRVNYNVAGQILGEKHADDTSANLNTKSTRNAMAHTPCWASSRRCQENDNTRYTYADS